MVMIEILFHVEQRMQMFTLLREHEEKLQLEALSRGGVPVLRQSNQIRFQQERRKAD